jgi:hypothetical protein
MRDERPRRRTAGKRLHHRRLDLGEIERIEEAADEAGQDATAAKNLASLGTHDEVDVTLPQLHFRIGDAVPFLR